MIAVALIRCPECKKKISDQASACNRCGYPISAIDRASLPKEKKHQKRNGFVIIFCICIISIVIGCVVLVTPVKEDRNAFEHLPSYTDKYCDISDDGSYMIIDTNPADIDNYFDSTAYGYIKKVNEELGFSSSLIEKMDETKLIDGRMEEKCDGYSVSWIFNPARGLEVIYEIIE